MNKCSVVNTDPDYIEGRIRIRIKVKLDPDSDPHQSDKLDPEPHQSDKLDPDPQRFADGKPKCIDYESI
jgi:hypothetical protein